MPVLVMRFLGKNGRGCGWLAALAMGALGVASVQAGGRGDKIQFSTPSSPVPATNITANVNPGLDQLNPTPGGMKQVQEDLFRPLKESLPSSDSMQGMMSLPPTVPQSRPQLSKHARELLDRKRNWAFTDLNDLEGQSTMEESLGLKEPSVDGKDKVWTSVIQRYYERDRQQPAAHRKQQPALGEITGPHKQDFTGATDYNPLLSQIPGIEPSSFGKKLFAPAQGAESLDKAGNVIFDGTRKFSPYTTEELAAQKHRDEFTHLLDPTLPATKSRGNTFVGGDPDQIYGRAALFGQGNQASPATAAAAAKPFRSAIYPVGITDPAAHSSVFDDPTAVALGMPNPVPVKTTTPPVTAESVQKMLDPFTGNLTRRRF